MAKKNCENSCDTNLTQEILEEFSIVVVLQKFLCKPQAQQNGITSDTKWILGTPKAKKMRSDHKKQYINQKGHDGFCDKMWITLFRNHPTASF